MPMMLAADRNVHLLPAAHSTTPFPPAQGGAKAQRGGNKAVGGAQGYKGGGGEKQ
jgi:hypothetical protein